MLHPSDVASAVRRMIQSGFFVSDFAMANDFILGCAIGEFVDGLHVYDCQAPIAAADNRTSITQKVIVDMNDDDGTRVVIMYIAYRVREVYDRLDHSDLRKVRFYDGNYNPLDDETVDFTSLNQALMDEAKIDILFSAIRRVFRRLCTRLTQAYPATNVYPMGGSNQ